MGLSLIDIGYLVNLIAIMLYVGVGIYVRNEVGKQVWDAIHKDSPKYSSLMLLIWLVPFIGGYSLIITSYKWSKVQGDNFIDKFDKYVNSPLGFGSKFFILKENKEVN